MTAFEEACNRWADAPFPAGSTDDAVDELHAELAQWDAIVADLAIPVAKGKAVGRPAYDIGGAMEAFGASLDAFATSDPALEDLVDSYRGYLQLARAVFAALSDELEWSRP